MNNAMHTRYYKHGILSGLLILTIIICVTADDQKLVFAQITPAPEKFGTTHDNTDNSHGISSGNNNPQGITPSEKTDDDADEFTDSTDSIGADTGQTTTEQDDGALATEEEQDSDPTNQLVEAITNEVNDAFSVAAGMIGQ